MSNTLQIGVAGKTQVGLGNVVNPPDGSVFVPTGLGWDSTTFPLTFSLNPAGDGTYVGSCSLSDQQLFDSISTARSAPGATFYVAITGSDSNAGTSASPFRSWQRGIVAANAAGVPTTLFIGYGGTTGYPRNENPSLGSSANPTPTVDMAVIATGGRSTIGTFDQYTSPAADGTYTNCYSWALSNVDRVSDLLNRDQWGYYPSLTYVATAAACNALPGSWALVSGTLYIHRADGAAVTNTNTRVFRNAASNLYFAGAQVNFYCGGQTPNDGFDFEGGNGDGCISMAYTSIPAAKKVMVFSNCTFRYAGGQFNTGAACAKIASLHGLGAFYNCDCGSSATDGFNAHSIAISGNFASTMMLVVNGTASGMGGQQQSCNGVTAHDACISIDLAGRYRGCHGGTARFINTSRTLLAGTVTIDDLGDIMAGGTQGPTAVQADNTAQIWCDRVAVKQSQGGCAYRALAGTTISRRNCATPVLLDQGTGTFATY